MMSTIRVRRKVIENDVEWVNFCMTIFVTPYSALNAEAVTSETIRITGVSWLISNFEICHQQNIQTETSTDSAITDMKYDKGKSRVDLLLDGCPNAIKSVSDVLTFGAKKYADHSWQGVDNGSSRYKAALMRHLLAHSSGELNDPESGLSHLSHVACNALFILELELKKDA
ncbi:hypothetical protein VL73_25 [Erwinia phage VL73]